MQAQLAGAFSQSGLLVRLSEISDRNRTRQPGKVTPHPDVQPRPTTWQTSFSGREMWPYQGTRLTSSKGQLSCG